MLTKGDSPAVREAFRLALERAGFGPARPESLSRIRVSSQKNIVLDDKLLVGRELLERCGVGSAEGLRELLSRLAPTAAAWLKRVLDGAPGQVAVMPLTELDFLGYEASGEERPLGAFVEAFKKHHEWYSSELRCLLEARFAGIVPERSSGAVSRALCEVSREEYVAVRTVGGAWVFRCPCGVSAVVSSQGHVQVDKRGVAQLEQDKATIVNLAKSVWAEKLSRDGIVDSAQRCLERVRESLAGYFYPAAVAKKVSELEALVRNLRAGNLVVRGEVLAVPGPQPPVRVYEVKDYLCSTLEEILNAPKVPAGEIQGVLRQAWENSGKELWEEVRSRWEALPELCKIMPLVKNAYGEAAAFAEQWEKGNLALQDGAVLMGGRRIAPPYGDNALAELKQLKQRFEFQASQAVSPQASDIIEAALRFFMRHPNQVGATTAAAILTGSRAQKIVKEGYTKLPEYGLLKSRCSQRKVVEVISWLTRQGLLQVTYKGYYGLPVLKVSGPVAELLKESGAVLTTTYVEEDAVPKAASRKDWEVLAEMAGQGVFAARAALATAAALWPSGKAARLWKEASAE
ncbi:RQC domain-containing protein [Thermanaeromonas toyohensis ToBE]|uniref:RQC domain-containing protein n=1 Tax=Thermanaeromonas toyohensis ToBE TaxID=698762 RepID=A0A1W1VU73_9FIRM|nr:RQC domain-containing protein [Thermanaeromonas toyohensis]SMB96899.1 RQC domain-containing protein [Thermanaeromonas toyohensis ToBE]